MRKIVAATVVTLATLWGATVAAAPKTTTITIEPEDQQCETRCVYFFGIPFCYDVCL